MDIRQSFPIKRIFTALAIVLALISMSSVSAFADTGKTRVSGKLYEFEKGHYDFSQSEISTITGSDNTYGKFSVQGDFTRETNKSGVSSFTVSDGELKIFYDYDDTKLNADEDSWHPIDEKSKKVDTITLNSNIMKGALILQISTDGKSWNTVTQSTDVFNTTPTSTGAVYTCTDMQLENGCYYRFIIAYTMSKREKEGKVLFVTTDKYDTKKYVEVYEFYAHFGKNETSATSSNTTYNLGETVLVKNFDDFSGEKTIDSKDIHYGWDLGNFRVSGFTSKVKGSDGTLTFLKNVGDQVKLSFHLKQNIDALNGDEKLTITPAEKVGDQNLGVATTNFGRGALIVRYKDYTGAKTTPQLYTNYLSAYATLDADTTVALCEEGDYEVALDYEVTKDGVIDTVRHYRIACSFSVRNGNCMVFPMDLVTGAELSNCSTTENGFRIDMAKSRYLSINVKYSVLNRIGSSYVEDTRFNRPAKDGDQYTDEGIYTITARSNYAEEPTVKRIIVGNDAAMLAYATNNLSLDDFNQKLKDGFTIDSDGVLLEPTSVSVVSSSEAEEPVVEQPTSSSAPESVASEPEQAEQSVERDSNGFSAVAVVGVVILVAVVAVLFLKKKKPDASGSHGGADE